MAFDAGLPTEQQPKPTALNKMTAEAFSKYLTESLEKAGFKNLKVIPTPPRAPPFPPHIPHDLYLLKRARDRLARGWTKKTLYDHDTGGVCAVGALLCAVQGSMEPQPQNPNDENEVERLASLITGEGARGLMSFNDSYNTLKEDVLMLFDQAIRRLEGRLQEQTRFDRYRYDPNYSRHQYLDSVAMV